MNAPFRVSHFQEMCEISAVCKTKNASCFVFFFLFFTCYPLNFFRLLIFIVACIAVFSCDEKRRKREREREEEEEEEGEKIRCNNKKIRQKKWRRTNMNYGEDYKS